MGIPFLRRPRMLACMWPGCRSRFVDDSNGRIAKARHDKRPHPIELRAGTPRKPRRRRGYIVVDEHGKRCARFKSSRFFSAALAKCCGAVAEKLWTFFTVTKEPRARSFRGMIEPIGTPMRPKHRPGKGNKIKKARVRTLLEIFLAGNEMPGREKKDPGKPKVLYKYDFTFADGDSLKKITVKAPTRSEARSALKRQLNVKKLGTVHIHDYRLAEFHYRRKSA